MAFAFVFPGQGSQSVGMLGALAAAQPTVRATFDEASAVLGYDLWKLVSEGPEEEPEAFDAGARPAKNFTTERADPRINLFEAVRELLGRNGFEAIDTRRDLGDRPRCSAGRQGVAPLT